ncbi:helix-turn-helix domain-containing protein [Nonomuraea turkmeniaca]|uniref:helix-turn-helix domain-containing protein n=1 Tax=Nonomuraea turkmeniaca TaxID=103838 RepID=UPI001FE3F4D5|nr:helix-turn-helix domain-containing protein [Nonomuraea turkmeniaca]
MNPGRSFAEAPAIAHLAAADEDTVRDVIRAFNERGLSAVDPEWAGGRPRRITSDDEEFIVDGFDGRARWVLGECRLSARRSPCHFTFTHEDLWTIFRYLGCGAIVIVVSDRKSLSSVRASIRLSNAASADQHPVGTWLLAVVAAWSVFTHIVGIVSGDPQSFASSGWGPVAQWIEHCLVLGGMLFLFISMLESLMYRYRRKHGDIE